MSRTLGSLCVGAGLLALFAFAGCGTETATPEPAAESGKVEVTHAGWWCPEHGVPEGECGQCNAKLAAEMKEKGDWCKEHDRPESQCFKCHPELEAKFAARYEAKFGEKPPKATE